VLARVPLAGGIPREVLQGVEYGNADWSPDGKTFAVVRHVERRFRLARGMAKMLVTPDGRAYVYETDRFTSELYVIEGLR
jgi:hypothetical protein